MSAPFLILALPRSRTSWLSRYLSCGGWNCGHEQARYLRSPSDIRAWASQPFTGSAETAVARWWRLIHAVAPEVRIIVIRRPLDEVVNSLMALDLGGAGTFDRERLTRGMRKIDLALDAIERHLPARSYTYRSLDDEAVCSEIFEYTLGLPFDRAWWAALAPIKIVCDMPALLRYSRAFAPQMALAGQLCLRETKKLRPGFLRPVVLAEGEDGFVIQEEPLSVFWRDAQDLFQEHCRAVGEPEDQYLRKNLPLIQHIADNGGCQIITVRHNGRMLGYLTSVIAPSLEEVNLTTATQTLAFVTEDAPTEKNLMLRMQRASIEGLRKRGVGEIYMRAGVRGDGPRLDILYRRLGAKEFGSLYKLILHGGISAAE